MDFLNKLFIKSYSVHVYTFTHINNLCPSPSELFSYLFAIVNHIESILLDFLTVMIFLGKQ